MDEKSAYQKFADITFLALTIWRESRGESIEGKIAVAFIIMNRVRKPKWWGTDPMSVVFKKWQFSSLTDPKDKQLTTWPLSTDPSWKECLEIAFKVYNNEIPNPIKDADHYYDTSIVNTPPKWANKSKFVKQIGKLLFYDLE